MNDLFNPDLWPAIPVLGGVVAWVGRVHQRVLRSESDLKTFTAGFAKHMADDALAHQRIANIEGQLGLIVAYLDRIDRRLDARE